MAKRRRQRIGKKGPRAVGKPKELMPLTAKGRTSRAVSTASSAATTATEDAYNNGSTSKTKSGSGRNGNGEIRPIFSAEDKRYIFCFLAISVALTAFYWYLGGRNLFVFPAIFLISVGTGKFWRGPVRRFAEKTGKA